MPVLECSRCNELYYSAHGSTELSCDVCGGYRWRVFHDEVSFARVSELPRRPAAGDHGVLLYTDVEDAAGFCAGFLRDGLEAGERTAMSLSEPLRSAIHGRLSGDAQRAIETYPPEEMYADFEANAVAERFATLVRESPEPMRLACGPVPEFVLDVPLEEWRSYERRAHELALELGATVLCVYDSRSLPIAFSPVAVESHTLISRNGAELKRNGDFSYEAG